VRGLPEKPARGRELPHLAGSARTHRGTNRVPALWARGRARGLAAKRRPAASRERCRASRIRSQSRL